MQSDLIIYEKIKKISTGEGDDYTTGCLLDYNYFKNYFKMVAIDLCKQEALDADPNAIQQIRLTGNQNRAGKTAIYFRFFTRNCESVVFLFCWYNISIKWTI